MNTAGGRGPAARNAPVSLRPGESARYQASRAGCSYTLPGSRSQSRVTERGTVNEANIDRRRPGRHPVSPRPHGRHAEGHCPWPACPKRTKANYLMCRGHWYALPFEIRARILANFRPGQTALTASQEYLEALRDALHYAASQEGGDR